MRVNSISLVMAVMILSMTQAFGAHPLITDDTGTQGKGRFQLEVNGEYGRDKETFEGVTTRETGGELGTIISGGITETADLVVGFPWHWSRVKEDGQVVSDLNGPGDVTLELKWRFFEHDGISFAVKPAVSLATGDEERGLGNGRSSYGATFITSRETDSYSLHLNLGYSHSDFRLDEDREANRADIWHGSLAGGLNLLPGFQAVGNVGLETNGDKASRTWPAFALVGVLYAVTEDLDVDFGVKWGLNDPETDVTGLAGFAWRF